MSMSVNRIENGFTYYCYDHSSDYQQRHKDLLQDIDERQDILESPLQTSLKNMHVEGILEAFVLFCRGEDYNAANMALEQIISYLQFVAHPFFNIANLKTRLEYRIMENRPFHISVLLYSHILSNKACHRTALELAKMLLNLDPSDPLDIMFIIDTFAIRAREYAWLIEAVDWFDKELSVKYLFNIKLSYALAHFHIAIKNK
ncbi:jg12773, partial [Pararge aegeria aegeria]